MRTLGLIGGTSWHSTVDYYRYINILVGEKRGTHLSPPLLLYSLNVELMRRGDWDEINQRYLEIALMLQTAGAEGVMICANTPHKVVPFVEPKMDIPFIHIADATGAAAQRKGLQKLGLLGTLPVMQGDYISGRIEQHFNIPVIVPSGKDRKQVHDFIANELTKGIFTDSTKTFFLNQMEKLQKEGADGIIMGCTEIPMLVKQDDIDLLLLDTTYLHAQKAVEFILG